MRYYGIFYRPFGQPLSPVEAADSKHLKWFTLFPELPFELRLVVWHIAIRFAYNPTVHLLPIRDQTAISFFVTLFVSH
jgi:hypothetical protein